MHGMNVDTLHPGSKPPVISVQGLDRTYRSKKESFTAVNGISFDVHEGEVFGLLGTNGAGKTTTLETLEGLAQATEGSISILGLHPLRDRAQLRQRTGIMLQSGGLPSQLTVLETITMWRGTCSRPRPASDVLEAVGLSHRSRVKVAALSGGEQRRLDLACALVGNPSIIFLDEPTTGLDPESRRNVWALLSDLKKRGVTMILTTHYLEEAERLCDRIAIMHEGQIALEGTLQELVSTAAATLTFRLPPSAGEVSALGLPALEGAHVTLNSGRVVIETAQLQRHSLDILTWAQERHLTLDDFSAAPASLETVFLGIAGVEKSAADHH